MPERQNRKHEAQGKNVKDVVHTCTLVMLYYFTAVAVLRYS